MVCVGALFKLCAVWSVSLGIPRHVVSVSLGIPRHVVSVSLDIPRHVVSVSLDIPRHVVSVSLGIPRLCTVCAVPGCKCACAHCMCVFVYVCLHVCTLLGVPHAAMPLTFVCPRPCH